MITPFWAFTVTKMECSSSNKARDEEISLEDVWSDLHALRKLYGLLQKSNAMVQRGETADNLDEKSRFLLKKLLDGATQQALQCQAKIISSTKDPPSSEISQEQLKLSPPPQEGPQDAVHFRNCHAGKLAQDMPSQQKREETVNQLVANGKLSAKSCPVCEADDWRKKNTGKSMIASDDEPHKTTKPQLPIPHRQIHHDRPDGAALGCPSKTGSKGELEPPGQREKHHRVSLERGAPDSETRGRPRRTLSGTRSMLDPADVAPTHKRSRVESKDLLRRTPSRPRGELTQMKARKASHRPSSSVRPGHNDSRMSQTVKLDATDRPAPPRRMGSLKDVEPKKESNLKEDKASQPSGCGLIRPEKSLSHHGNPSRAGRVTPRGQLTRVQASRRDRGSGRHQSREAWDHSSSSTTRSGSSRSLRTGHTTRSETEPGELTMVGRRSKATPRVVDRRTLGPARPSVAEIMPRHTPSHHSLLLVPSRAARSPSRRVAHKEEARERKPPRRMPSKQWEMHPARRTAKADHQKKPEKKRGKEGGRLRRLKNKLAIVFHHHHHHHLHHDGHVEGGDARGAHAEHHHLSPWRYVRKLLPRTSRERAAAEHGYLHALLHALLRHVWGTRQRKAAQAERRRRLGKAGSRVGTKKRHWWQRFKRRGGLKLANRRKPRLRLGFTRTRSRATKKS